MDAVADYIEGKEAVLGGFPDSRGPKFIKQIKKWLQNNDNAERV